jgi:hypothetical protein
MIPSWPPFPGPLDPRLAPPYQQVHHTKGDGEIKTLPNGTRYKVYPFNSAPIPHPTHPNDPPLGIVGAPDKYEHDVLSYLDGDPAEFKKFIDKLYRAMPPVNNVEDVDRNYTASHRYWDALKRGMAGTGPYPQGLDWLSDFVIRRSGAGM